MAESKALQGVEQAVRVLEYVADSGTDVRLTHVVKALDMSQSTVHRLLRSWCELGYLDVDESGGYRLGGKLFELAGRYRDRLDLRSVARPFLAELNRQTNETIHLSVLDGAEVVYLDKIEGRQPIRVYTAVGRRGPLHATASGKAIMAFQDDEAVTALVGRGLEKFNRLTTTGLDEIQRELDDVRDVGYVIHHGEWHEEVAGIGAPVFDSDDDVRASLSATFPTMYSSDEHDTRVAELLLDSAAALSKHIGYTGDRFERWQARRPEESSPSDRSGPRTARRQRKSR